MKNITAPRVRPARLDDYQRIRQLGLLFSLDLPIEEDWRNLWLNNPLRDHFGDALPLGWMLETHNGDVVGTMGTVLVPYTFQRRSLISAVSRAWFVKNEYRAFALHLMDEYLHQPQVDLFINTAVSVPAQQSFRQFCEPIPVGTWDCMSYFLVEKQNAGHLSSEKQEHEAPGITIEAVDRFDPRFDTFWRDLVALYPEKLLADRSSRTLTWHFGAPRRRDRLWIFTASRRGSLRAYCTLTLQDNPFQLPALPLPGDRGIRSMRLVDYQSLEPGADLLGQLLNAALERCGDESITILENLGRGVPKMEALDRRAPYLEQLSNWKFYYAAADSPLQEALAVAQAWDPSSYDGDASFE